MPDALRDKIINKHARIGIIGLGYVGLPLAVEFARKGFRVFGIDINKERVRGVNVGRSYVLDVLSEELKPLVKEKLLSATSDYRILKDLDAIIICVPTPLRKTKEPDISYVLSSSKQIAKYIRKDQLIVLESTTYPGTTEEMILPLLESKGLKVGRDFYLAFSPERVDPSNKIYTTANIPKVVGGVTGNCTQIVKLLYGQIIKKVIAVSSPKVAEMVKLLENTFRAVNIGLINEICLMCNKLKINVWEVIEAAKTKPFGFMSFYPGPGIGGECIPADPIYLSWKARLHGFEARFIELASQINSYMPNYVVERITNVLNERKGPLKGSKLLILGVAYKKDVSDTRESPALEIIKLLKDKGSIVSYYDPYVPELNLEGTILKSIKLTKDSLKDKDCSVIITDHSSVDYSFLLNNSKLILDTRNILRNIKSRKLIKL
jgi:UDP-N-acetyl-D-glucosamine dehydrogenase